MSALRSFARRLINRAGFDLVRVPRRQRTTTSGLGYYETPIGNYYVPLEASRDNIAMCMRTGRVFEPEVVAVAERLIAPGSAVIDLGANFGQMTLLFARAAGPQGRVYAIEAQRRVYEILERNLAANQADNVVAIFGAALERAGETFHFPRPDFARFGAYGSYNLPLDAEEGDEVTSMRIDDLEIDRPVSFMKVDVQGCDLFAMKGALETIRRHRMPILFEYEERFQQTYRTRFQDYVEFVASIGYEFAETVLDINYLVVPRA